MTKLKNKRKQQGGRKAENLVGQRFGKLVVLERSPKGPYVYWVCQCDCGNTSTTKTTSLKEGHAKTCGCSRKEPRTDYAKSLTTTHGHVSDGKKSVEYRAWQNMHKRCKVNAPEREFYAGRGIGVCKRWRDFTPFFSDMGFRPSSKHTLDRIDNNKGYAPGNCRWATRFEQMKNTRSNIYVTYNGVSMVLSDLAKLVGVNRETIRLRYHRGVSMEELVAKSRKQRGIL